MKLFALGLLLGLPLAAVVERTYENLNATMMVLP